MVSAITSIVGCIRNRASARPATKTKPQQPFGCAAVTQQKLHKNRNAAIASDISPCLGC